LKWLWWGCLLKTLPCKKLEKEGYLWDFHDKTFWQVLSLFGREHANNSPKVANTVPLEVPSPSWKCYKKAEWMLRKFINGQFLIYHKPLFVLLNFNVYSADLSPSVIRTFKKRYRCGLKSVLRPPYRSS
jgi:hypothetical protein